VLLDAAALVVAPAAHAQARPAPADSARRDSSGVQSLPGVSVTVTREAQPLARAPWAVGVAGPREQRDGHPTNGRDEQHERGAGEWCEGWHGIDGLVDGRARTGARRPDERSVPDGTTPRLAGNGNGAGAPKMAPAPPLARPCGRAVLRA
jgi:hypothetical protein